MASSSLCLRCFKRSLIRTGETPRTFSTSASLAAAPKKKSTAGKAAPARRTSPLRKAAPQPQTGRHVAPGERRAYKKRVVLSNTNAEDVPLEDLTSVTVDALVESHGYNGKVLGLTGECIDAMRALEAFKPAQGWNYFRRPATLVRTDTIALAARLGQGESGQTSRLILHGERGSGKTVLLLQAMSMAWLKGWIVLHFPEGNDLTNSHTSYAPMETDGERQYVQRHYTAQFLTNIVKANYNLLSTMRLSQNHDDLPIPIQSNISLSRFAELGARDPELAWPVWNALWQELTAPTNTQRDGLQRPPVFVGFDGVDHVMRESEYLDAAAKPIHAHHLALVRQYLDLLSGRQTLPNGGAIVAAVSESNRAGTPTFNHFLKRARAKAAGQLQPAWDPYVPIDPLVESIFTAKLADGRPAVDFNQIKGLSKHEARGILEYYEKSGILKPSITEGLVTEKWTLSGGGIIGALERGSVRMTF